LANQQQNESDLEKP